jgi:hypothetical protein
MISVENFEPAQERRTSSSPARHEQHWCLPTLHLIRSLGTLYPREMRMKRETVSLSGVIVTVKWSHSSIPPPPHYFCRGSRFAFPGGARCDPSAIKQAYENAATKVCLSQHDLSCKLLKYRYPANTDHKIR